MGLESQNGCVTRICDEMFELEGEMNLLFMHPVEKVNKEDL